MGGRKKLIKTQEQEESRRGRGERQERRRGRQVEKPSLCEHTDGQHGAGWPCCRNG